MNMLKTFVVFLISFPTLATACASFYYGTYYIEHGYNILHKDIVGNEFRRVTNSQYIPFYNEKEYDQREQTKQINLKEWSTFLKVSPEQAEKLIYEGEDIDKLDSNMQRYLRFIRQVEPLVDYDHQWDREEKTPLKSAYDAGITVAESALEQDNPDFLKLRYLFGAMRLAHYSKQYDKEQALYNHYYDKLSKVTSEVKFWIAALKAGMDKHQGKKAQAAYQFAKLFEQSTTKRYTAYVDFSISSDAEWQELMSLCKNDDEKALMHFIRALKPKANSLQELKQIYDLAPDSIWLDALLARELEYVQFAKQIKENKPGSSWFFSPDINKEMLIEDVEQYDYKKDQKLTEQKKKRRTKYINELADIVQQIRSEGKHKDLFIADLANVYLALLTNKPVKLFDVGQLQIKYADDARVAYLEPLKLFVYLENIPTINATIESEISIYLKRIQKQEAGGITFEDILTYTYIKLEPHYEQEKAAYKHYISKVRGVFNPDNILVFEVRDLKKLQAKTNKNFLEQQMIAALSQNYSELDKSLDEIIVTKYLSAGMFSEANALLSGLNLDTQTKYNPFNNNLSGNNRTKSKGITTQDFTKKLLALKADIKQNPNNAQAHYLLANAFYNMTWFGNSPKLVTFFRSTSSWKGGVINFDNAKAHYQLAVEHAQDDELKTKALYGLAKIEFNEKYMEEDKASYLSPYDFSGQQLKPTVERLKARQFGKYFKQIEQYKDTDYFNDVIKQCAIYTSSTW